MKIILFTGEHCPGCQAAKDLLKILKVPFEEIPAEGNLAILESYEVRGLPTLLFYDDGRCARIEGYAPKRIKEALNV